MHFTSILLCPGTSQAEFMPHPWCISGIYAAKIFNVYSNVPTDVCLKVTLLAYILLIYINIMADVRNCIRIQVHTSETYIMRTISNRCRYQMRCALSFRSFVFNAFPSAFAKNHIINY